MRHGRLGFAAGLAAGAGAVVVLFAYRFATGIATPMEALAERMIRLLPYQVFALVLAKLQHLAKPIGFVMAILTVVLGYGLIGVAYARATRGAWWSPLRGAVVIAAASWLFVTFLFLPLIEGPALGVPLTTVVPSPAIPMALASLVYGGLLALLCRPRAARMPAGAGGSRAAITGGSGEAVRGDEVGGRASRTSLGAHAGGDDAILSRRRLLSRSALVVLAAAAGTRLGAWAADAGARAAAAAREAFRLLKGMPPEVTPNGKFYQISKNFFDPTVDVVKWKLEIKGEVAKPLTFTLKELMAAAPAVERHQTFECISNEVGGDLIGNAKWKGVRVKDLLEQAGVKPGATTIIWRAADGFSESIPLPIAMDPEVLLAYEMNGEAIPQKHGAPVRVLLVNRYGMKQPKWLTSIEVANHDYTGYWEQQGWSKEAIVKVNSAFSVEEKEGGLIALGGWAFAGNRGIAKVEFSPDGGKTWLPAAVKDALGRNCWQFWSAEWKPPGPGTYTFKVRARDGAGTLQPEQPKPTLPDGGQGYHTVSVRFG